MARLSADLGVDPLAVLNAPGELYEELALAHRHRWTHTDELLALAVEMLDGLSIMFAQAWSDPGKRPRPRTPYRYPRPQLERARRQGSTPEQIRKFFRGR